MHWLQQILCFQTKFIWESFNIHTTYAILSFNNCFHQLMEVIWQGTAGRLILLALCLKRAAKLSFPHGEIQFILLCLPNWVEIFGHFTVTGPHVKHPTVPCTLPLSQGWAQQSRNAAQHEITQWMLYGSLLRSLPSWGILDGALCAAQSQMPSLENFCGFSPSACWRPHLALPAAEPLNSHLHPGALQCSPPGHPMLLPD